jgi:hypothetical protein
MTHLLLNALFSLCWLLLSSSSLSPVISSSFEGSQQRQYGNQKFSSATTFIIHPKNPLIQRTIQPLPSTNGFISPSCNQHRRHRQRSPFGFVSSQQYGGRTGDEENYIDFDASIIEDIRSFDPYRDNEDDEIESDVLEEMDFLRNELVHLESLEDLIQELEKYDESFNEEEDEDEFDDIETDMEALWDEESLDELLNNLPPTEESNNGNPTAVVRNSAINSNISDNQFYQNLEQVLLQGVVPVQADVGSECMVGDFGFDPLHLSDVDLFRPTQKFLLQFVPSSSSSSSSTTTTTTTTSTTPQESENDEMDEPKRPQALILRDYREAEIRHGRLAMLAAMIWPIQEMLDKFILSEEQFGPLLYGPVTLPYFPLFMTAIMLLLGYLDIYSQAIKDMDQIGDAFLPGDCFWDPLQVLQGAPDKMRRNMQERELFNGRAAMIAIGAYVVEESVTHKALVDIGSNELLLQPAYEIPFIQEWLDNQFSLSLPGPESDPSSLFMTPIPDDNASMLLDTLDEFVQSTMILLQSFLF